MHDGAKPESKLQSRTQEEYGDRYQDHVLEQYKLFVTTSQQISERRQQANNFLLTLSSSLVTLFVAFVSTFGSDRRNALVPVAGLFVCFVWHSLVKSYKSLNTAKFAVIHELEEQLPIALFRHEWYVCGRSKDKDKYIPLTRLERWIPWMFGILFAALTVYAVAVPSHDKAQSSTPTKPPVTQQAQH